MTKINVISNAEAFTPPADETNIPIDGSQYNFNWTRRWFKQRNQKTWSTFLGPKFPPDKPYNAIQIGVFEGMDLTWLMQNCLSHPDSRVLAIDPWLKTRKLDQAHMDGVMERAKHNLSPWKDQIDIVRGFSGEILEADPHFKPGQVDLLIIDGDHKADPVYEDARLGLELMKKGGWIVFDDVRQRVPKPEEVEAGLRRFLGDYGDRVKYVAQHRYCDIFEVV